MQWLIIFIVLLLPGHLYAQAVWVESGFLKGENYLLLEPRARHTYVIGLIDGMLAAPLLGGSPQRASTLKQCIEGMTDSQLDAILSKYLKDNPDRWNIAAQISMVNALTGFCPGIRP